MPKAGRKSTVRKSRALKPCKEGTVRDPVSNRCKK